jgi:long-chain acyl-CoA synthetase
LYDTLGPNVVEYCINHSTTRIVFAQPSHIPQLLKLAKSCPKLKAIVSLDSWKSLGAKGARPGVTGEVALKAWAQELGVTLLDIEEGERPRPVTRLVFGGPDS